MNARQHEVTEIHTRLLKCGLEVDDSRAYWTHAEPGEDVRADRAFEEYWFGARSLARIAVLLTNMRARFNAFPEALATLHRWSHMSPEIRKIICHWHVQLSDPLYRRFTGFYLAHRRGTAHGAITRDAVVTWVGQQAPGRWTLPTQIQFASKLLTAAHFAGLVGTTRDPRPLTVPHVPDEALEYLMYLLRETEFAGTLLENPYTASVGLDVEALHERFRRLPGLLVRRQGSLVDFEWRFSSLRIWAQAKFTSDDMSLAAGAL